MKQFTDWFQRSQNVVDTSRAPDSLEHLPAYLLTNFLAADDGLWNVGGEFAFNHSLLIGGVVGYTTYSGDNSYLEIAKTTADWQIENSTPADWAMPYLGPSFVAYQPDGTWVPQEWGYEPDKSAYLAVTFLRLYVITGIQRYLTQAKRIGDMLKQYQGPEGNWPFRMNAQTGEVQHEYTASQLWYVWMYERLAEVTGDQNYLPYRDRAFQWLLENPVQTNEWIGLYGDIPSGARSYDQWVPLEVAMYLIERRHENPDYLPIAEGIINWVVENISVDYGYFPGVAGLWEQSQYPVVLTHHELRLAEAYARLWEATGNMAHKREAIEVANSVTWVLMSDGKMRQGQYIHAQACPLVLSFNDQFLRVMGSIPETAPKGESHLLQSSSLVRDVRYQPTVVTYQTMAGSYDVLVVASRPTAVVAGTQALDPVEDPQRQVGWRYDRDTGLLRLRHEGGAVKITLHHTVGVGTPG